MVQIKIAKEGGGYQGILMPAPVVEADTYCSTCLNDMVREKEAGLDVRLTPVSSTRQGGVIQGRKAPKSTKVEAKERRDLRMKLARKFLEDQKR